ncbi:uncharacterized protein [Acropora muricata]|uniref:uncharacterized protein isoform X1 n=1 Tax=Acropora muricata TaxID=159855 RepID=UPI0034E601F7
MEPLDKARMKVTLNRSRLPATVVVILVSLVFILAYNYWSLSASNSALRQELRHGENYQLSLERRRRVLEGRISEVEAESRSLRGDLLKDRQMKMQATTLNADLKLELQAVRDKLQSALDQERVYREELEKLKTGVNGSSSQLRALSTKAEKLLEKFNELKLNYSSLLEKIGKVTTERDNCKKSLKALKLELEEAKKSQDMKKSSNKEKSMSKGKKGGKADDEESSEVTPTEEEASEEAKVGKKSETGEENLGDEDEGGKEDNVDKDEKNIEKQDEREDKEGENVDTESQNSTSSSSHSANAPGEKKSADANQPSSEADEKLEVANPDTSLASKDKLGVDTGGEQQDENKENSEVEEKDDLADNEQGRGREGEKDLDPVMKRDTRLRANVDSDEDLPVNSRGEGAVRRKFVDDQQAKSEDEKLQDQGRVSQLENREIMRNADDWADARMERP